MLRHPLKHPPLTRLLDAPGAEKLPVLLNRGLQDHCREEDDVEKLDSSSYPGTGRNTTLPLQKAKKCNKLLMFASS
jgi:hypothetical protein